MTTMQETVQATQDQAPGPDGPEAPTPLRWTERSVVAFGAAGLLILAVALVPDPTRRGLHPDDFARMRTQWTACADMVLLGDSRVLCGLSPSEMSTRLDYIRVRNLGFAAAPLDERLFGLATQVLDGASPRRSIVLGITVISLAEGKGAMANLGEEEESAPQAGPIQAQVDYLARPFAPRSPKSLAIALGLRGKKYGFKHYHEDGWLEGDTVPNRPDREVTRYRAIFRDSKVPVARSLDRIARQVRQWRSEGIRVYAFRPPTCQAMVDLENRDGGYDQELIRRTLTEAGVLWLDVDQTAYATYDGSHVRYDDARRLSRDLAELIRKADR